MKQNLFNLIIKRFFLGSLIISATLFFRPAYSQSIVPASFGENKTQISYIGTINNAYVFNVRYDNDHGDKFMISILDDSGNILFAGTYSERKFTKKFNLLKEGNDQVRFVIRNLNDDTVQRFDISTTTRMIEDVVVKKVQ